MLLFFFYSILLYHMLQGDTKKTELTKSLITPEILFSLEQKFSWIMYNLCSQHLQSLNSVQQKLFALQPLKDMFQMRPLALQVDLDLLGKIPNDPPALLPRLWWLPWGQGWSGGCAHTPCLLEVTPQIEVWGVQVWWVRWKRQRIETLQILVT